MILSAVAAVVLAVAMALVLGHEQELAYEAYRGSGARVGDPGYNLVGPDWSGLNKPATKAQAPSS
jgi:hypothetical protein